MINNLMTAQQAFNVSMNTYPLLYAAPSLDEAKIKYFDHVFNTIGNGINEIQTFVARHQLNPANRSFTNSFPVKYSDGSCLFMAYTEVRQVADVKFPVTSSILHELFTKEELESMPEVVASAPFQSKRNNHVFSPYPNFSKCYSMVWNMDVTLFHHSWVESAFWYYTQMKTFFNSETVHFYHSAPPIEENKLAQLIADYESNFRYCKVADMSDADYFKAISDAYELDYNGDTLDFIKRRWSIELSRINIFIDETLDMLDKKINKK